MILSVTVPLGACKDGEDGDPPIVTTVSKEEEGRCAIVSGVSLSPGIRGLKAKSAVPCPSVIVGPVIRIPADSTREWFNEPMPSVWANRIIEGINRTAAEREAMMSEFFQSDYGRLFLRRCGEVDVRCDQFLARPFRVFSLFHLLKGYVARYGPQVIRPEHLAHLKMGIERQGVMVLGPDHGQVCLKDVSDMPPVDQPLAPYQTVYNLAQEEKIHPNLPNFPWGYLVLGRGKTDALQVTAYRAEWLIYSA